ncbi:MAG: site-specific integrase, partial [Gammaproteobacteria bacterium]|nr:site-specific integrase [Gammaproteobacteria bacterium]
KPFDGEKPSERHYSDDELRAIWRACDEVAEPIGTAVKLMLLTGKRRGEVFGLRWDELDLDLEKGFWNLPAERTKNKRAHKMPLPKLAVRILESHPKLKGNPYVFWGRRKGGHLNGFNTIQKKVRDESKVEDFAFHTCRHTLKTRLGQLGIPPHVKDKVLHHAPPKSAGEGYDHYDYESEQREALEAWADQLQRIVQGEGVAVLR